jgi:hypothetical protein
MDVARRRIVQQVPSEWTRRRERVLDELNTETDTDREWGEHEHHRSLDGV